MCINAPCIHFKYFMGSVMGSNDLVTGDQIQKIPQIRFGNLADFYKKLTTFYFILA